MNLLRQVAQVILRWLDSVSAAIIAMIGWISSPRAVQLVEDAGGAFTIRSAGQNSVVTFNSSQLRIADSGGPPSPSPSEAPSLKGCLTEILLQPSRFIFRQIELPRRAHEFLDGIIRAQIDRLTPWSPSDAAYGWTPPIDIASDRIVVTIAATAKAQVMPFVQAATDLGADSIIVSTTAEMPDHGGMPIQVLQQNARTALDTQRIRRVLIAILVVAGLVTAASVGAAVVVADDLRARQDDLSYRIAERRTALRAGLDAAGNTAIAQLERRKHETPSTVLVLEALSQVLPDHTFVTELRIENSKIQVIGITRDAPALIGLIEQSRHFTRATFFAPTTRSPSDPGERFHIEANIEPIFTPRT